ncbi:MAG: transporter [Gemmatimonadetes bacterium]|nr:transporter [Gemmatimonadota bacterium]
MYTEIYIRSRKALSNMTVVALAALAVVTTPVSAQYEWTSSRPDGHAPIGVMGEHTHEHGEFMFSYRFMRMLMDGNRDGTDRLEPADVHASFMVAPLDMTMTMHMAGFMYAPSDAVTLMAMANWVDQSMNHVTRPGGNFEAVSSGLADASLSALIGLKQAGSTRVHLNAGVSLPTGSIEETGTNPMSMGQAVQMPYPMQLGSGTWDLKPGITVLGMSERASWGLQGMGTLRLGENSRGYRKGHVADLTGWFAVKPGDRLSLSARVLARRWGNYGGHDHAYHHRMMVPTVREELRGGTRVDIPLGFNVYFPDGALKGHRIAAEWHVPVYQNLNGPQLETDWLLTLGWQKSFAPPGHD